MYRMLKSSAEAFSAHKPDGHTRPGAQAFCAFVQPRWRRTSYRSGDGSQSKCKGHVPRWTTPRLLPQARFRPSLNNRKQRRTRRSGYKMRKVMFALMRRPLARMWEEEMRRGEPQQCLKKRGHRMMTTRPRARNVPLLKRLHVLCQLHVLCVREHTNPFFPMQRRPPWVLSRGPEHPQTYFLMSGDILCPDI